MTHRAEHPLLTFLVYINNFVCYNPLINKKGDIKMAAKRNINTLKDVNAKIHNILGKFNYSTGAGWCIKRDKKRAKRSVGKSLNR